jgi:hypothetical protein
LLRNVRHVCDGGRGRRASSLDTVLRRRRAPVCRVRRECAARPTTRWLSPSQRRVFESPDQRSGDRLVCVSSVESIGNGANRDASAKPYPAGRAPRLCANGPPLLAITIQNVRSRVRRRGRLTVRFNILSWCRNAMFRGPIPAARGRPGRALATPIRSFPARADRVVRSMRNQSRARRMEF